MLHQQQLRLPQVSCKPLLPQKQMSKPVVVSAIVPKQEIICHPKNTKPEVLQAKTLFKKYIREKVKLPLLNPLSLQFQFTITVAQLKPPELNSPWFRDRGPSK